MAQFRLFDLPRELRDEIYRRLITPIKEIQHGADEQDTGTYTFDAPILAVLLSNLQLSSEYRDLLPQRRKLLLQGAKCDYWTGYHPVPQSLANVISDITVFMHIVCYCDNLEEEEYEDQLNYPCDASIQCHGYTYDLESYLNHYPNVETVHVKMCMFRREDGVNDRPREPPEPPQLSHTVGFPDNLKRLVALPGIKDLEIMGFSSSAYESYAYEDYLKGRKNGSLARIATWTTAHGWKSDTSIESGQRPLVKR